MLQITPRDRLMLQLLAEGTRDGELASVLEVTAVEITEQLLGLYARMGVHSRLQAVAAAVKRGLIAAPSATFDS
jgi:LuxR family maltose regulon positive regulatory protein